MRKLHPRGSAPFAQHILNRTGTWRETKTVVRDKEILEGAYQRIVKSKEDIFKTVKVLEGVQERLDEDYRRCLDEICGFYQSLR